MTSYSVIYLSEDGKKSEIKLFCKQQPEPITIVQHIDEKEQIVESVEISKENHGSEKEKENGSVTKRRFSERIRNGKKAALPKESEKMGQKDTSKVEVGEVPEMIRSSSRKGSTSNPTTGTNSSAKMKNVMATEGPENTAAFPKENQCKSVAPMPSCLSESVSFGSSLNAELSEIDDDSSKALKRKRIISEEDIGTSKVAKSQGTSMVEESSEHTDLNNALLVRQLEDSTQLNEARKELIRGWKDYSDNLYSIGIKRMGELDPKTFRDACSIKNQGDEEALKLCSFWQSKLSESSWHPFQVVQKEGEEPKEILKENDEGLKMLKAQYGVEVFNAVHRGLLEINEYNPSGRYPIEELWNFKENRRATLKEAISVLFKMKKE